ncbi:UDP-glucose 4-epimerase GalE, partial [Salmonella enterica]|nr:UDP-glucose 4-epimerase GalE [Salmonella enterica]EBA3007832.1 UDP-glucose 4-epimerase GalE [Salmonella enterica]EHY7833845.1 UDP-glucose 4-epimerase GalE [Salmonella enterica]
SLDRVENISSGELIRYQGDVRDRIILKEIFYKHDIDAVIHLAGLKSVNESIRRPLEYYDNNTLGTLILLEEMHQAGVYNLIFSSSATVYGNPQTVPISETHNTGDVINPYGRSKYMAENILKDYYHANNTANITILRYFNPVGAHESGLIGEDPNDIPNNLFPYITQVAIGKLTSLKIFGNDYETKDGTGVRDYIHVVDLAEGHLSALKGLTNKGDLQIYNLGTGNGHSVMEVINAFQEVTGTKIPFTFSSRRQGDVAECWSDASLAREKLQWAAKYSLKKMVTDAWRWQKMNPNGYKNIE